MPVKAKPVEYVKICTLYGAGFYYLPGTDICVKHGAYIRAQAYYNWGNNSTTGPFIGTAGQDTIFKGQALGQPNDVILRGRSVYTLDARTQTEYGTLRAYVLIGATWDSPQNEIGGNAAALYATRGFLQFAGFTMGRASSFYDIFSNAANSYIALWSSDTGDAGQNLFAYTFQFGNGFSATIAAEDPRRNVVVNTSVTAAGTNAFLLGATSGSIDQVQVRYPDVVANLRVDQAWGSVQIMGALHDASGGYFLPSAGVTCNVTATGGTLTGQLACGHPDDELGFAVGIGGIFRVPMPTGLTDVASFQVNYTEGASRYAVFSQPAAGNPGRFGGTSLAACPPSALVVGANTTQACLGSIGLGQWSDAIYANPGALPGYDGSIQKTKVWGVNAAWDHLWTPNLKTSVYGAWINVEYNGTAALLINTATCGVNGTAANTVTRMTNGVVNGTGVCDPDFTVWMIGSRTQWNITPSFYVGFDVTYQRLETAFAGNAFYTAAAGQPRPSGNYSIEDQDIVSFTARAHWDILP